LLPGLLCAFAPKTVDGTINGAAMARPALFKKERREIIFFSFFFTELFLIVKAALPVLKTLRSGKPFAMVSYNITGHFLRKVLVSV